MNILDFLWTGIRYYVFESVVNWYKRLRERHHAPIFIFESIVLTLLIGAVTVGLVAITR